MKKKLKVITVLTLTTVVLGACGSNEGTNYSVTPTLSKTEGSAASQKEKLNLQIMIEGPANARLPGDADDFVKKVIEEKFNVKLTVEYMPAGQDYINKLNARLAANEPPDMWRDVNGDGGQKYALDGVLGEIGNFINPVKMPNYFKYWVDDTTFQRYQIQGKVFRAPTPYSKELFRTWYIRKDWLE